MEAKKTVHADHYERNKEYQLEYRRANKEKRAAENKLYRAQNAEQINARRAEYRKANRDDINDKNACVYRNKPEIWILSNIKKRCKERGIPFDLSLEDVVAPDVCPVFGFPLKRNKRGGGFGGPLDDSPAVDRIKPELGYVKGNIIIVSHLANRIKSNATPEQIGMVANFYKKLLEGNSGDI